MTSSGHPQAVPPRRPSSRAPRVLPLLVSFISVLALAAPAHAADELLGPLPGAKGLSAYGGWVVFSSPTGSGAWSLKTWHDGVAADVAVPAANAPFDVNVGPDVSGRPTAVYSRCRTKPFDSPPTGCDLFAVTLGEAGERRLPISTARHSEFAPAIWGRRLAFGRRSRGQRKADVMLARGPKLKHLGPGTLPRCQEMPCDESPSTAWPTAMDLGPHALAYLWALSGGDVYGAGYGLELRITRLDRRRARIAESGFFGGACEFAEPVSPNVLGTTALYGFSYGDVCATGGQRNSFRRFSLERARRAQARPAGEGHLISVAWDGPTVYWLRRDRSPAECEAPGANCTTELLRSPTPAFRAIKGGEAEPPLF
jgi:hypothetical protein